MKYKDKYKFERYEKREQIYLMREGTNRKEGEVNYRDNKTVRVGTS